MTGDNDIPDLEEALRETAPDIGRDELRARIRAADEGPPPPPPGDWTTHPATRTILILILLGAIGLVVWKAPAWIAYMQDHPFGAGITLFLLALFVVIVAMVVWRTKAQGDVGDRVWDTDRKRKKR